MWCYQLSTESLLLVGGLLESICYITCIKYMLQHHWKPELSHEVLKGARQKVLSQGNVLGVSAAPFWITAVFKPEVMLYLQAGEKLFLESWLFMEYLGGLGVAHRWGSCAWDEIQSSDSLHNLAPCSYLASVFVHISCVCLVCCISTVGHSSLRMLCLLCASLVGWNCHSFSPAVRFSWENLFDCNNP